MSVEKLFNDFVKYVEDKGIDMEGIAIADEKKIICSHRFTPEYPRNIYSHTKSYMATAVGIAIDEGKLSLDDKLVDYFPECLPKEYDPGVEKITLRNLLMMASGFNKEYLMSADRRAGIGSDDYIGYMLSQKIEVEPGSRFMYSSADSILAGRMLEKAIGQGMGDFLYQRVFSKLGQGWPIWEHDRFGHAIGCGGLYMTLSDQLKLGQLYLNGGVWNGERIVSEKWVKEATSNLIDTVSRSGVWYCGYGYQFWMMPYKNAYRADGAHGQITIVFPDQGLIVSFQCPEYGDFNVTSQEIHDHLTSLI